MELGDEVLHYLYTLIPLQKDLSSRKDNPDRLLSPRKIVWENYGIESFDYPVVIYKYRFAEVE